MKIPFSLGGVLGRSVGDELEVAWDRITGAISRNGFRAVVRCSQAASVAAGGAEGYQKQKNERAAAYDGLNHGLFLLVVCWVGQWVMN